LCNTIAAIARAAEKAPRLNTEGEVTVIAALCAPLPKLAAPRRSTAN
jgi:hypothetical protein